MIAATWIVVANSSAARIFSADDPNGPLTELESIVHPEGRLPARELTSDLPGRAFDSAGHGRHTMESEVGPRQQAAVDFAILLARRLERARVEGDTVRLVLVSPSGFLGLMRKSLTVETRRLVVLELNKNFVKFSPAEIRERLPERLY